MINLKKETKNLEQQKNFIISGITEYLKSLDQNPKIKSIGKNSFEIKFSDLSIDFKIIPAYYDFKFQYNLIISFIEKSNNPLIFLQEIIKKKKIIKQPLNPEVIKNIQKLLE